MKRIKRAALAVAAAATIAGGVSGCVSAPDVAGVLTATPVMEPYPWTDDHCHVYMDTHARMFQDLLRTHETQKARDETNERIGAAYGWTARKAGAMYSYCETRRDAKNAIPL